MKCGLAWGNAGSTFYILCNSRWKYNLHYLTNTICTIRQIHFTLSDKYNLHGHMNQLHSSDIDSSPTHCVPLSINWMESAEGKCMEIGGMMKAHDDRNGRWTSDCDCWLPWASLKPPPMYSQCSIVNVHNFQYSMFSTLSPTTNVLTMF